MRYDSSTIFHSAHATARHRLTNSRAWRSYRRALADALRREWMWAKQRAVQAEIDAEAAAAVLPPDVIAQCSAFRLEASYEPWTFAGRARFRALNNEADDIAAAALAATALASKTLRHSHIRST